MKSENFVDILNFVKTNGLTTKEIEVLIPFFSGNKSSKELVDMLDMNLSTLYPLIQRLKYKGLIKMVDRTSNGINIYQLNIDNIEE